MELLFNLDICDIYNLTRGETKAIPVIGKVEDSDRLSFPIRGYGIAGFDTSGRKRTMRLTSPKVGIRAGRHDVRILNPSSHTDLSRFGACLDKKVCISFIITELERATFDENGEIDGDFGKTSRFCRLANIKKENLEDYFQEKTRDVLIAKVHSIEVFEPLEIKDFKRGCKYNVGTLARCDSCSFNTCNIKTTAWCTYIGENLKEEDVLSSERNWHPVILIEKLKPKEVKDADGVTPIEKFFKNTKDE